MKRASRKKLVDISSCQLTAAYDFIVQTKDKVNLNRFLFKNGLEDAIPPDRVATTLPVLISIKLKMSVQQKTSKTALPGTGYARVRRRKNQFE